MAPGHYIGGLRQCLTLAAWWWTTGILRSSPPRCSNGGRARGQVQVPNVGRCGAHCLHSFTPNSAACERVFSLLKFMFGDQQQWATLGDYIQAALMLSYNERAVG